MNICLDYDDTYTKAPALWDSFIDTFQSAGHKFVCITQRGKDTKDFQLANGIGKKMQVIYTAGGCKRKAAGRHNWHVDVWIDDKPDTIPCNTSKAGMKHRLV